jgi:L-2-hydroxyglutarate oxidase
MTDRALDVVIIGGGILGCATALTLLRRKALRVAVLEKEAEVAAHQTGHNSGVIHAGLYYKPGSLKATTCARGRALLERFCADKRIPFERCGKLVVATREEQIPRLDELERRGRANGLTGLTRVAGPLLREYEPHVAGVSGLHVAETGIVDYRRVTAAYAEEIRLRGGAIVTWARAVGIGREEGRIVIRTTQGSFRARCLVNCAGLMSDRVARLAGVDPGVRIVPFRGEYYVITAERRGLVKNLIYPVPDPAFPFLGVHFTRRIGGEIEAGPNAVLALKREGYTKTSFSLRDAASEAAFPGLWRLAARQWKTGFGELWRSWNKSAFVRALQELVPDVTGEDLEPAHAGVRAQAMRADGSLVDDFHIALAERMVHVLNAPSPAATASLAIGETVAGHVMGSDVT